MSANAAVELRETEYGEWNALVAQSPEGSIYSTPEYLDALCTAAGGRFRVVAVRRGDDLAGGLALYERDTPFGTYVSPRLLLYYNGIVLRRYDTKYPSEQTARAVETLGALAQWIGTRRYGAVMLKCRGALRDVRPFLVAGWRARPSYSYIVPLDNLAGQWDRVEQNLRRLVKRCERDGMTFATDGDFAEFYRLHSLTLGRRGVAEYLPAGPFERFYSGLAAQGLARLYQARLRDGRTAAVQLVLLGAHPVSHTVSAAGDPEFNKTGAQAFLRWRTFEALAALGYKGNDLTDAALNPVTHFKAQLGGDLDLSLVLESAPRPAYRAGVGAMHLVYQVRGAAGAAARRLLGRSRA